MVREETGSYRTPDGLALLWRSRFPDAAVTPRGHVVVVHGYGDHSGRYIRFMDELCARGFVAHAFDYRGHGRSEGRRGHCGRFSEFLDDLDLHLARVRKVAAGAPLFVFGHSHGGLMLANWAVQRDTSGVRGVVYSNPFLGLAFEPPKLKLLAARIARRVLPTLSLSNELTSDQLTRDVAIQQETDHDPLYLHVTTPGWFFAARGAQEDALARAAENLLPSLVLLSTADPIADAAVGRQLYDRLGATDKSLQVYEDFRHEILNEIGRERVYADIAAWVDARL